MTSGPEPLGERGRADHVAEEDGDLLALPLEGGPRLQDLLGEMGGRVALEAAAAPVRARWRGSAPGLMAASAAKRRAALAAELEARRHLRATLRAGEPQLATALPAELHSRRVVELALRAVHGDSGACRSP